jgi:hypothetical protein
VKAITIHASVLQAINANKWPRLDNGIMATSLIVVAGWPAWEGVKYRLAVKSIVRRSAPLSRRHCEDPLGESQWLSLTSQ